MVATLFGMLSICSSGDHYSLSSVKLPIITIAVSQLLRLFSLSFPPCFYSSYVLTLCPELRYDSLFTMLLYKTPPIHSVACSIVTKS